LVYLYVYQVCIQVQVIQVPISGASLVKRKKSARVDVITINGMQQHERVQKDRHLQWKIPIFFSIYLLGNKDTFR